MARGTKSGRRLKEYICGQESAIGQLSAKLLPRSARVHELAAWPEVRPALEQSNVHSLDFEHCDQVQGPLVREQGEGKIGAG